MKNPTKAQAQAHQNFRSYYDLSFTRLQNKPTSILRILSAIQKNPGFTPKQLTTYIGIPQGYGWDTFWRIRQADLARSANGHYEITELGNQLLNDYSL